MDFIQVLRNKINEVQKCPKNHAFFQRQRKKWSKIKKKHFGFFLVSYISIQKKSAPLNNFHRAALPLPPKFVPKAKLDLLSINVKEFERDYMHS